MKTDNLNKFIQPNPNDTKSTDICLRGKVNTGTKCNYNCYFCYYKDRLDAPEKDYDIIINEINQLIKSGIKEIEFSGGESSIHSRFIDILKYTYDLKKKNIITNISMLSHGGIDKKYWYKIIQNGLDEVLFSLHGWDKISHDKKVGKTNAFYDLTHSMIYTNHYGLKIRINTTVSNDFNIDKYIELIEVLMKHIKISQINFLPLNYWEDANSLGVIDYDNISSKIKRFIDKFKNEFDIRVRYIPFCFMINYEKYVYGIYQHIYDKSDWNIQVYENYSGEKITKEKMFETAFNNRLNTYIKPTNCTKCKYLYICDGIEEKLLSKNKLNCINNINDKKIKDIKYFLQGN